MPNRRPAPALPPLPARLRRKGNEPRSAALLRLLRETATAHRADQAQTFYSLREVAGHFKLPLSLVRRVFVQLEEDGLLGKIRGSRTVLHGVKYDRNLRIRGIVSLPVSISRFALLSDYRAIILQLRRQLRRRKIMPAAVFFEKREVRGAFLAERILEARADTVIWISPDREIQHTVDLLRDAGVRLVGAGDCVLSWIPCRYQLRREQALRKILRHWKAQGLTETIVVTAARGYSSGNEPGYRAVSEEEGLRSASQVLDESSIRQQLPTLLRQEKCGLLLSGPAAALSLTREPETIGKLMRNHRVALVEGTPSLLFTQAPEVKVEMITFDWQAVGEEMAADLAWADEWEAEEQLVFQASAHLDVPLEEFCGQL